MADVIDKKTPDELADAFMEMIAKYPSMLKTIIGGAANHLNVALNDKREENLITQSVILGFTAGYMQAEMEREEKPNG